MPLLILVGLIGMIVTVQVSVNVFGPWVNRLFARVWSEDRVSNQEVASRLKELYIDSDIPIETAVMMAATETNRSKEQILDAFDAMTPADIGYILKGKPGAFLLRVTKSMSKRRKIGM